MITASLGAYNADTIMVAGWQLGAFFACVILAALVMFPSGPIPLQLGRRTKWGLVALFVAALFLRVFGLGVLPAGLHVDELGTVDFTLRHVFRSSSQTISPFRTGASSQPALYNYITWLSLKIGGESIAGLRLSSAFAGSLGVMATVGMVAVLHKWRTAWFAGIYMAVSHFAIHWSRIGLNNIWDTLWVPLSLGAYAWGWNRRWDGGAVIAGLALGFSQYFYFGSKLGIFLLGFLFVSLWRRNRDTTQLIRSGTKCFAMAAVIAAPIFIFTITNPDEAFRRLTTGFAFSPELPASVIPSASRQFLDTLLSFTSIPENTGFYRPGVPLVLGLAAPLLVAGFIFTIYKRRFLPAIWIILTMLLGGFILFGIPASNHYVVAIPAIAWLVAIPLNALTGFGRARVAWSLLVIMILSELVFYFAIFSQAPPGDLSLPFPPHPLE